MLKELIKLTFFYFIWNSTNAATLVVPANEDIVGEVQYAVSEPNETLYEVGKRYGIGHVEMIRANPKVHPIQLLSANTQLIIPSQFILPKVERKGVIINLADYRLYYFPDNENVVVTFPIGIGRKGWKTPLGLTKIVAKVANPQWRPTAKLQAEAEKHGSSLPDVFPAGPYNPLGRYALRLGWATFLIHGTNRDDGIGSRVSAGCIRMFPDDIEHLFKLVSVGTPVRVINEPVKVAKQDDGLFIQLHPMLNESNKKFPLKAMLNRQLSSLNIPNPNNNKIIQSELKYPTGLIKKISS